MCKSSVACKDHLRSREASSCWNSEVKKFKASTMCEHRPYPVADKAGRLVDGQCAMPAVSGVACMTQIVILSGPCKT